MINRKTGPNRLLSLLVTSALTLIGGPYAYGFTLEYQPGTHSLGLRASFAELNSNILGWGDGPPHNLQIEIAVDRPYVDVVRTMCPAQVPFLNDEVWRLQPSDPKRVSAIQWVKEHIDACRVPLSNPAPPEHARAVVATVFDRTGRGHIYWGIEAGIPIGESTFCTPTVARQMNFGLLRPGGGGQAAGHIRIVCNRDSNVRVVVGSGGPLVTGDGTIIHFHLPNNGDIVAGPAGTEAVVTGALTNAPATGGTYNWQVAVSITFE